MIVCHYLELLAVSSSHYYTIHECFSNLILHRSLVARVGNAIESVNIRSTVKKRIN